MSGTNCRRSVGFVGPKIEAAVANQMTEARMSAFPSSEHQQYLGKLANKRQQIGMFPIDNGKMSDLNDEHQNASEEQD